MGRAGKDDLHLRKAPLSAVLEEAAEPHFERGKVIVFEQTQHDAELNEQPEILRKPEIIHGMRNLVQNAVDFAKTTIWVETSWSDSEISVRIVDDGAGFPLHLIGRIGDPFVGQRKSDKERAKRPEYEGMGLGLFIAKTLLERSGAKLQFSNGGSQFAKKSNGKTGAVIDVTWPRDKIDAAFSNVAEVTGENLRNQTY
jgi:two-component system sensor histidine kinase RegB